MAEPQNPEIESLPEDSIATTQQEPAQEPEVVFEDFRSQVDELSRKVVDDILNDEEHFTEYVKKANVKELTFLLEQFAYRDDILALRSKAKVIRQAFDDQVKGNTEFDKDELSRFNTAFARFNKRSKDAADKQDKEREENSARKKALLDKLQEIVKSEDMNRHPEVRDIMQQWRAIGHIRREDLDGFREQYDHYLNIYFQNREKFGDLVEQDRKYNLEEKQRLIAEAQSLLQLPEQISADFWKTVSDRVKELQENWKSIGKVPEEVKDTIYEQFRQVIDQVFAAKQAYFDSLDAGRKENGEKKRALLSRLLPFKSYQADKARDWNDATTRLTEIQAEWKLIGPAPGDENTSLWQQYRDICDTFFKEKAAFFASFDKVRNENLKLKEALCEQAESLMDNSDWKATAEKIRQLQEEWKTIGPVHERFSNKVWKRFRAACDHFFNRREEQHHSRRSEEEGNLQRKREVLSQLAAMAQEENPNQAAYDNLRNTWREIGFVPIKEKDKVQKEYDEVTKSIYRKLREKESSMSLEERLAGISDPEQRREKVRQEIQFLQKKVQGHKETISQYDNNMLMIARGKSGDSLRAQIHARIAEENGRIQAIEGKIRLLKDQLKAIQ